MLLTDFPFCSNASDVVYLGYGFQYDDEIKRLPLQEFAVKYSTKYGWDISGFTFGWFGMIKGNSNTKSFIYESDNDHLLLCNEWKKITNKLQFRHNG